MSSIFIAVRRWMMGGILLLLMCGSLQPAWACSMLAPPCYAESLGLTGLFILPISVVFSVLSGSLLFLLLGIPLTLGILAKWRTSSSRRWVWILAEGYLIPMLVAILALVGPNKAVLHAGPVVLIFGGCLLVVAGAIVSYLRFGAGRGGALVLGVVLLIGAGLSATLLASQVLPPLPQFLAMLLACLAGAFLALAGTMNYSGRALRVGSVCCSMLIAAVPYLIGTGLPALLTWVYC